MSRLMLLFAVVITVLFGDGSIKTFVSSEMQNRHHEVLPPSHHLHHLRHNKSLSHHHPHHHHHHNQSQQQQQPHNHHHHSHGAHHGHLHHQHSQNQKQNGRHHHHVQQSPPEDPPIVQHSQYHPSGEHTNHASGRHPYSESQNPSIEHINHQHYNSHNHNENPDNLQLRTLDNIITNDDNKLVPQLWSILDKMHKFSYNYLKSINSHNNDDKILSMEINNNNNSNADGELLNINSQHDIVDGQQLFMNSDENNTENIDENNIFGLINNENLNINNGESKPIIQNQGGVKCPKCSGSTNNVRVSEEELTKLRIEFVKSQILQKLRLKERPQVSVSDLPRPIYEGLTIINDQQANAKDLDDYYARTKQKFIFLEQRREECVHVDDNPSMCFSFKIDGDVDSLDVNSAELWVYRHPNSVQNYQGNGNFNKQTLVVSKLEQGKYLPIAKPIAMESTEIKEGWIKIVIEPAIKVWFNNHEVNHIIRITCQSCNNEYDPLFSTERDYRPFIVIDTVNRHKRRRQKRNVNCSAGVTECCREKLYISFADIGWSDWIVQPPGYDAYFCRGACSPAATISTSSTYYGSFLKKMYYKKESDGQQALELVPCCTAKQFSSLQLIYLASNNTATLKTLPNMVVESCGCL